MKKLITVFYLTIAHLISFTQTNIPQLVSFSAVVRDANNQPIVNTPVSIRLTFKEGGQSGPLVYCALHQDITNQNGFISVQLNRDVIATGCNGAPSNDFEQIPWENGGFWMEVEYQTLPGSPFENLGQLELASSFYAFAAKTAEKIAGVNLAGANDGDVLTYNISSGEWEPTPASNPVPTNVSAFVNDAGYLTNDIDQQQLSVSVTGDTLYLQNGGSIIIPGLSEANDPATINSPVVITNPVTNISSNNATFSGNIPNANGNQIVQRGMVYSELPNLTMSSNIFNLGNGAGVFDTTTPLSAPGATLSYNTTYYVKAFAVNNSGTIFYGNQVSFTTLNIGQTGPGGGIVFFDKGNFLGGWQYLELAPMDQSTGVSWGCQGFSIFNGNPDYEVGEGEQATNNIVQYCSEPNIAALLCSELVLNSQNDWFLPSWNEHFLIYKNLAQFGAGNFYPGDYYWSSTEYNSNTAGAFKFQNGNASISLSNKSAIRRVRGIRAY